VSTPNKALCYQLIASLESSPASLVVPDEDDRSMMMKILQRLAALEESNTELQESNAELQESNAELQERDADQQKINAELQASNEELEVTLRSTMDAVLGVRGAINIYTFFLIHFTRRIGLRSIKYEIESFLTWAGTSWPPSVAIRIGGLGRVASTGTRYSPLRWLGFKRLVLMTYLPNGETLEGNP
jgi:hypothetical protein